MDKLTKEECAKLDEYYTIHTPRLKGNGTGMFAQAIASDFGLDRVSINYITALSNKQNMQPASVINSIIHEHIAATV
jgi:hypothetical protein